MNSPRTVYCQQFTGMKRYCYVGLGGLSFTFPHAELKLGNHHEICRRLPRRNRS
jgi:hypothetical protein